MRRVLQIGMNRFEDRPGGLSRFLDSLLHQHDALGVDTRALVCGNPTKVDRIYKPFAEIDAPLPQRLYAARRAVGKQISEFRPHVVVSHFALYASPALDHIGSLPFVVHFQGPWADEARLEGANRGKQFVQQTIERIVYARARRLIVLSKAFGAILENAYRIDPDKIRVIPGAIDIPRFAIDESQADARAALGWPTDRPIISVVRRLVRRMGLENLIDASLALRARHPDILVKIVGGGHLREELQRRIDDLGLSANVNLVGFVPDLTLPLIYRASDLTVVPSVALEGFGLIAAESLAAGTPVIVTPVGGLPEVVRGLSEAMVTDDISAAALATAITQVLLGELKLPSANACAAYAASNFSIETVGRQVLQTYEEAIG